MWLAAFASESALAVSSSLLSAFSVTSPPVAVTFAPEGTIAWVLSFLSFEEREVGTVVLEATVHVSTESLLMEGARRIDELDVFAWLRLHQQRARR